jgi:siroheme synthase
VALGTLATIAEVAEREGIEAPAVTVIGEVARMAGEGVMPEISTESGLVALTGA